MPEPSTVAVEHPPATAAVSRRNRRPRVPRSPRRSIPTATRRRAVSRRPPAAAPRPQRSPRTRRYLAPGVPGRRAASAPWATNANPLPTEHAGDTELGKFADRRHARKHEHVDRHVDGVDKRLDLVGGRDPGGVHDVGTDCGVRLQSGERVVESSTPRKWFSARGSEHEPDRTAWAASAAAATRSHGQVTVVDRLAVGSPNPRSSTRRARRRRRTPTVAATPSGSGRVAILEVGTDRQRCRRGEVGAVGDRLLTSDADRRDGRTSWRIRNSSWPAPE